jgi:hypothetical protein
MFLGQAIYVLGFYGFKGFRYQWARRD